MHGGVNPWVRVTHDIPPTKKIDNSTVVEQVAGGGGLSYDKNVCDKK